MRTSALTRRQVLKGGLALGATGALGPLPYRSARLLDQLTPCTGASTLADVEHIVIVVQENRSFDNYFGTFKGVRGFDDRSAPGGSASFRQGFTPAVAGITDPMLPWHIDTAVTVPPQQGQCTNDIEHQWAGQHDTWNGGRNDNWMGSHLATERDAKQAAITMGYYARADLPFYYALADTFTVCDNYYCSVIGGTDINRLYSMTGTLDPDGWDGGCQFLNTKTSVSISAPGADLGAARRWVPYPEVLQRAGISWKVYSTPDGHVGDNVLRYFPQFRPGTGDPTLAANAFSSNAFPADFVADCQTGRLPQVSWLLASLPDTEHAPAPVEWGESIVHTILAGLTASGVWSRTVMFLTYDENGGFFDHVPPPTAPPGTAGEYLNQGAITTACRREATTVRGRDLSGGPVGLGYRVPMLVISPFTRNPDPGGAPLVCSDALDHTSILRFVETWSAAIGHPAPIPGRDPAARVPGLSPWRRATVGDLTGALDLARAPDASVPTALLSVVPNRADPAVLAECITTGTVGSETTQTEPIVQDPSIPKITTLPVQERFAGNVRRPSGVCATGARSPAPVAGPAVDPTSAPGPSGQPVLPVTGALPARPLGAPLAVVAVATVVAAGRRRRQKAASTSQPAVRTPVADPQPAGATIDAQQTRP